MDIKILLVLAAGAYILTSRKSVANTGTAQPQEFIPNNSHDSEQALLDLMAPGSVHMVKDLKPVSVNSSVNPMPPSPPGEVVQDLISSLPAARMVESWTCPDGQIPNPEVLEYKKQGIRSIIKVERCIESSKDAYAQNDIAPTASVYDISQKETNFKDQSEW